MNRTYTIRELTKEFGVTARTLRHYEDEGLIAPARRGQARIYNNRVQFKRMGSKVTGFDLLTDTGQTTAVDRTN